MFCVFGCLCTIGSLTLVFVGSVRWGEETGGATGRRIWRRCVADDGALCQGVGVSYGVFSGYGRKFVPAQNVYG